jgi:hypothetical protein
MFTKYVNLKQILGRYLKAMFISIQRSSETYVMGKLLPLAGLCYSEDTQRFVSTEWMG